MLTFYHCYTEDLWEGYEKNGLLNTPFGIRFPQSLDLPKDQKFNAAAAKGGKLYELVRATKCGFYIDRLQGGCYIENYPYDRALLDEYEKMLGDRFLGFQMHEWLSNYRGEIHKKLADLPADRWTEDGIREEIFRRYPFKNLFLESMTAAEMAELGRPESARALYDNMTTIYRRRLATYKKLVPCDSYCLMFPFEAKLGATVIMPEVGAQIPDMRLQMCYARGVCRAYGIKLGAYYEPWGGDPLSACSYCEGGKNEWNLYGGDFPYETAGAGGGSSRSLQFRIYLYAYLSGAEMISEEWGGYNTFLNDRDYTLSEYGLTKKRFLDFVARYPDLGEKLAPIAAVVSNDLLCYELKPLNDGFLGYPMASEPRHALRAFERRVGEIFCASRPTVGSEREQRTLGNYLVPDAVDMLDEGDGRALTHYEYLVDLTGDPTFSVRHANVIAPDEVTARLDALLPCRVEGDLHYVINRRGENGYYLTVFHHGGVTRSVDEGERVLPEAERTVRVTLKNGRALRPLEGSRRVSCEDGIYTVTLGGGEFFFAAF